jgi:hypothetical protein
MKITRMFDDIKVRGKKTYSRLRTTVEERRLKKQETLFQVQLKSGCIKRVK